jgi:signal transduction histidine kinase
MRHQFPDAPSFAIYGILSAQVFSIPMSILLSLVAVLGTKFGFGLPEYTVVLQAYSVSLVTIGFSAVIRLILSTSYLTTMTARSDKIRAEALIESRLAISIAQMTQMVAHDIRTPLIQTRNLLTMMNQDPDLSRNELLISCNSQINKKIENVEGILNDILLSKSIVRKANVSVQEIVDQAWLDATVSHDVSRYKMDMDASGMMYVDSLKFKRVFENIFRNAIEAMPDGGVLSVKTIVIDAFVETITISNNGPKIEESKLHSLFEPHYSSGKINGHGHGLGLAISRKIVEDHEGGIAVDSDDTWTAFKIHLPFRT